MERRARVLLALSLAAGIYVLVFERIRALHGLPDNLSVLVIRFALALS